MQFKGDAIKRKKITGISTNVGGNETSADNLIYPKSIEADNYNVDENTDNTTSCQINLDAEHLKWMPLFYSTGSDSYLMPQRGPDINHTGNHKLRKKRKYGKVHGPKEAYYDANRRWLNLSKVDNGEIIAVCPGSRLQGTNSVSKHVTCISGRTFVIHDQTTSNKNKSIKPKDKVKFSDISCAKSIKETILPTHQTCGPLSGHGKVTHIGWTRENKETDSSFTAQITVCHDRVQEHTYFTNHTLYGSAIDSRDAGKSRQVPFKEGGLQFYASSSASKAYKMSSQKQLFAKLLPDIQERSKIFVPG